MYQYNALKLHFSYYAVLGLLEQKGFTPLFKFVISSQRFLHTCLLSANGYINPTMLCITFTLSDLRNDQRIAAKITPFKLITNS